MSELDIGLMTGLNPTNGESVSCSVWLPELIKSSELPFLDEFDLRVRISTPTGRDQSCRRPQGMEVSLYRVVSFWIFSWETGSPEIYNSGSSRESLRLRYTASIRFHSSPRRLRRKPHFLNLLSYWALLSSSKPRMWKFRSDIPSNKVFLRPHILVYSPTAFQFHSSLEIQLLQNVFMRVPSRRWNPFALFLRHLWCGVVFEEFLKRYTIVKFWWRNEQSWKDKMRVFTIKLWEPRVERMRLMSNSSLRIDVSTRQFFFLQIWFLFKICDSKWRVERPS